MFWWYKKYRMQVQYICANRFVIQTWCLKTVLGLYSRNFVHFDYIRTVITLLEEDCTTYLAPLMWFRVDIHFDKNTEWKSSSIVTRTYFDYHVITYTLFVYIFCFRFFLWTLVLRQWHVIWLTVCGLIRLQMVILNKLWYARHDMGV